MGKKVIKLSFSEFFETYLKNKTFTIEGWSEEEEKQFKINYQYINSNIIFDKKLKPLTIKNLLFNIGLFPSNEEWWQKVAFKKLEKRFNEAIEEEEIPALGLDTNIVVSGIYLTKLKELLREKLNWQTPLILLSLASSHELHYSAESTYNDSNFSKSKLEQVWGYIESLEKNTKELVQSVFGTYSPITNKNHLGHLRDKRGRVGIIGSYNYYLHKKLPNALIIKSIHPYNTAKFTPEGQKNRGIDAIYDTLIAYEFTQFMTFTNTKVTILTMDSSLASLLQNASVDVIYIPPASGFNLPKEIEIPQRKCSKLIRELLVLSPFVLLNSDNRQIALSSIWLGQTEEERAKGAVHGAIKEQKEIKYILLTDF